MTLPEGIEAMLGGPGRLRFIIQPIVAILLGIRDGHLDARAGKPPYFISLLSAREPRRDQLRNGLGTLAKPLIVAIIIDLILQYFIFRSVHLWHAVVIGAVLVALPYVTARGWSNRWTHRSGRSHA